MVVFLLDVFLKTTKKGILKKDDTIYIRVFSGSLGSQRGSEGNPNFGTST